VAALLLASGAQAEDITIDWQQTGVKYGTGYLPKVASDGLTSLVSISQTGTGFSSLQDMTATYPTELSMDWTPYHYLYSPPQSTPQVGHAPSIALVQAVNAGVDNLIEVHQGGQDNGGALWYQLASASAPLPNKIKWSAANPYGQGYNPTVAADLNAPGSFSTAIVEVHQAGLDISALWYEVGILTLGTSPSIVWGPSIEINGGLNQGYAPTVSIANNIAVLVAQGTSGALWYSIGTVDTSTSTIAWTDPDVYTSGYNPSVSVYGDGISGSGRVVVEAHQGDKGTGPLLYRTGILGGAAPTSINWTPNSNVSYSKGCYPSVALSFTQVDINLAVNETHSSACSEAATLYASLGDLVEP
jgi:hypothetical protein